MDQASTKQIKTQIFVSSIIFWLSIIGAPMTHYMEGGNEIAPATELLLLTALASLVTYLLTKFRIWLKGK